MMLPPLPFPHFAGDIFVGMAVGLFIGWRLRDYMVPAMVRVLELVDEWLGLWRGRNGRY